jgi:hypothetical protein
MNKPSNTVKLRILRSGTVVDNGKPLLRGMTYEAHPAEAAFLLEVGSAEVISGEVPSPRSIGRRYEAAAMPGPIGR